MRKKLLLLLTLGFLCFGAAMAQYVTLQDTAFRDILVSRYPTCFNALGQMDTTCYAITHEVYLGIADGFYALRNMDGIKYFKRLKQFNLDYAHNLTTLAQLPDSLEEIYLTDDISLASMTNMPKNLVRFENSQSMLTNLPADIQFTKLKTFSCINSLLTSLPPLPSTIEYLNVANNKLTSLPRLDTLMKLTDIFCNNNKLTSVPALRSDTSFAGLGYHWVNFSGNLLTSFPVFNVINSLDISYNKFTSWPAIRFDAITELICGNNPINYLPTFTSNFAPVLLSCQNLNLHAVPNLPSLLTTLDCGFNPITTLANLPNGLTALTCNNTLITNLSGLPASVAYLDCGSTQITNLINLPAGFTHLYCDSNNISTLPALPGSLKRLSLIGTKINCLPKLPTSLEYLYINSRQIRCLPNSGSNLVVLDSNKILVNLPFCNATNNANACHAFPLITGSVFYDLNTNGILDAGEYGKKNFKVSLSNGAFTLTNDIGFYQISPDTLSNVSLVVNPPALFNAMPTGRVFSFTTSDTLVLQDIALQPTVIKDSVVIYITPWTRARPGFGLVYGITYENVGTTNLNNASLVMHYDPTLLTYNSSSNSAVIHSGNTLSLNSSNLLPVGGTNHFSSSFTIKTTAPLGTILKADGAVTSGSAFSSDTSSVIITGSFDPNDKTATAKLTPAQLAADGYVDYVVRFQNTGTDTAIHVVLADTLSSKLKANTLQVIATSHLCKTTVKDKVVTFEMRDIMLPDSNVNEFASHGFVRFRVKPVSGLVLGDTITNTAAIYFDYNSPVITNTAVTKIVSQTFPLKLLSFKGNRLSQGNVYLYWQTANEENTKSFDIEQSSNGRNFEKIGELKAYGNGNHSYTYTDNSPLTTANSLFYRLKMIDKDGKFTYAPIVLIKAGDVKGSFVLGANPVNDKLVINAINPSLLNTEAALINSAGVVVKRFVLNGASQTVVVDNLPAGTYYLRTQQGSERVVIVW